MMRNKELTVLAVLLAATLVCCPPLLLGGAPDGPPPGGMTPAEKFDELQKQIKALSGSLEKKFADLTDNLKSSFEDVKKTFEDVQKDLTDLRKDITQFQKQLQQFKDDKMEQDLKLAAAQEKMSNLEKMVAELKGKITDIALNPPTNKGELAELKAKMEEMDKTIQQLKNGTYIAKSPPGGGAKLLLVNKTVEEILFLVNGQSYRVAPMSSQILDIQPPDLNYEVISPYYGPLKSNSTKLNAGETFRIQVG
jgi:septal ring factor EnvC (AmiA/AmiB activator)